MIRYTADGKVDRDMVSVPSFGTTTKDELADALDDARQVNRDAIRSMRECEERMRAAEALRDAMMLIERYQLDIQFFGAMGHPQGVWRAYQSTRCELDSDLWEGWGDTPMEAVIAAVAACRTEAGI